MDDRDIQSDNLREKKNLYFAQSLHQYDLVPHLYHMGYMMVHRKTEISGMAAQWKVSGQQWQYCLTCTINQGEPQTSKLHHETWVHADLYETCYANSTQHVRCSVWKIKRKLNSIQNVIWWRQTRKGGLFFLTRQADHRVPTWHPWFNSCRRE